MDALAASLQVRAGINGWQSIYTDKERVHSYIPQHVYVHFVQPFSFSQYIHPVVMFLASFARLHNDKFIVIIV